MFGFTSHIPAKTKRWCLCMFCCTPSFDNVEGDQNNTSVKHHSHVITVLRPKAGDFVFNFTSILRDTLKPIKITLDTVDRH